MGFEEKSEPISRRSGFWRVDMQLLPLKAHYFVFMGALGCVLPFRTVFAKQLGVSATAVGVIFLAVPFMKIVTNPLFGVLGDYFKKFRLLIAALVAIVAISHLIMIYIPPLPISTDRSPANHVRVSAEYDSSTGSGLYLRVAAEVESKYLTEPLDFSCELRCRSNHVLFIPNAKNANSQHKMTCMNHNISAFIDFQMDACRMDFHFKNERLSFFHNSTREIVQMSEISSKIYRKGDTGLFSKPNCTSHESFLRIFSEYEPKPNETDTAKVTNSSEDSLSKTGVTGRQKLLLLNETKSPISCHDKTILSCIVHQCKYTNGTSTASLVQQDEFQSGQFWALFFLIAVSSTTFSAVLFLIDTVCYEMIQYKKASFGVQRLWGTIGWGLGALAGGYLNQLISDDSSHIDYSLSFYLLVVLMIVNLIPVSQLKVEDIKYSSSICRDIFFLLTKPHIGIYIIIVFVNGVLSGLVWNYQFWFMEEIGASQVLLGLSQVSECLFAELPCFIIAHWVTKKIGYVNCNSLSLLSFGLRYLCLAFMYNPWWTLAVGLFNGPCFGIFYAAMTMYGKNEAPPGTEATVQAVLAMAFEGIGCGLGSILGGVGFDKFGSRRTFLYSGIASFIFFGINIILHVFYFRKRGSSTTK